MVTWLRKKASENHVVPPSDREILSRLAFESLKEQRRARRWGIFFKAFFAVYLLILLFLFQFDGVTTDSGNHSALINLEGIIAPDGESGADRVVTGLRDAFKADNAKGVILRINSAGGSPVQAQYINAEIRRLREKHPDKPVYAVVSDVCASGGYYVAVAADRIYASQASIIGSIGVLMNGFGFVDAMKKVGVERRLMTAGKHKAMMDPFSALDPVAQGHTQEILDQVHEQFIEAVKRGRGDRLVDNEDIFSGLFWTGEKAKQLGLIDEFGSAGYVAREVIGAEKIINYTPKGGLLERVAERIGTAMARTLAVETIMGRLSLQ